MININENYLKLQDSYLFSTIAKKVSDYVNKNPDKKIIKLGIGDVTKPIVPTIIKAIHNATDEMGKKETFRGYGPEQGYDFLREKIVEYDYKKRGVNISKDEIFISDGAKCDTGNIGELFSKENTVAIQDPVYPVYLDTNIMAGRAGQYKEDKNIYDEIIYMKSDAQNNFVPKLPNKKPDMIYLCFPNNPTRNSINKRTTRKMGKICKGK